jgi:hypothetical protein
MNKHNTLRIKLKALISTPPGRGTRSKTWQDESQGREETLGDIMTQMQWMWTKCKWDK